MRCTKSAFGSLNDSSEAVAIWQPVLGHESIRNHFKPGDMSRHRIDAAEWRIFHEYSKLSAFFRQGGLADTTRGTRSSIRSSDYRHFGAVTNESLASNV